ncbi:hypothetical protein JCM3766R1_005980 [Sporobolomyces carnicolor]
MSWVYPLRFSNVALDDRSLKAAFPSLRAFTLHGDAPTVFDANLLDSVLGALSQQVDVIMARTDTLRSLPSIFASVEDKTLFDSYRYCLIGSGTRPVNARLLYDPDQETDVAYLPRFVRALATSPELSELSLLFLPPVLSDNNHIEPAHHSTREKLLEICRDRKIEVVFEENAGDPICDSIVPQDFWKRRREARKKEEGQ